MSSIALRTGAKMPLLGLGTWLSSVEEVKSAVHSALDSGYRLIDTAFAYNNEGAIGEVLQEQFKAGKLKREDVFITTKLIGSYHASDRVMVGIKKSLENLQLDYVDLYLIHTPCAFKPGDSPPWGVTIGPDGKIVYEDIDPLVTWKAMEEVYNKGLAKAIGISNFNQKQIQHICDNATVIPHNLQVECHLYFPQFKLHDFCTKLGITLTAYGPIGSPGRGVVKANFSEENLKQERDLDDPTVAKLSEKYGKTPAQILLRYLIDRKISAVPKSTNPKRIKENFQVFDFKLTEEEMKELNGIGRNYRLFHASFAAGHPHYPHDD